MAETTVANSALQSLEVLIGYWETEGSFAGTDREAIKGHASFEWIEGGAFLLMRSRFAAGGPPASISVFGRESDEDYSSLYFDERDESRIYSMRFDGRVWTMWRAIHKSPGFAQRFTGTLSDDGKTIDARWEKSGDGMEWEEDLYLTYQRSA